MLDLGKLFGRKITHSPVDNFWSWFSKNEKRFRDIQNKQQDKAADILDEIIQEMSKCNKWLKALIGKYDSDTYELIVTADGDIALFALVEDMIAQAPALPRWKFTAHKPRIGFDIRIEMYGKAFDSDAIKFYPIIDDSYPDLVSIILTHSEYSEDKDEEFQTAANVYLGNTLGELDLATKIDKFHVGPIPDDGTELIPITKLNDYLLWREKEFIEKYDYSAILQPEDSYSLLEASDDEGNVMIATINMGLKNWEYCPAFPWLLQADIDFEGTENGLPDNKTLNEIQQLEDEITATLELAGPVYLAGHSTYAGRRCIYYYCPAYNDYSKLLHNYIENKKPGLPIVFFIRRDKYWQEVSRFYGE